MSSPHASSGNIYDVNLEGGETQCTQTNDNGSGMEHSMLQIIESGFISQF